MEQPCIPTLGDAYDWRSTEPLDWPVTTQVGPGLAGVIAAETRVVWLDPSSGALAYRGVPIEQLVGDTSFEEVAHLLITGLRPHDDTARFDAFRAALLAARGLPEDVRRLLRDLDPGTHPTRALRAGVSALGCHELDVDDDLAGRRHWQELRILGQVAALVADVVRHRRGLPPADAGTAGMAAGILEPLAGRPPTDLEIRALERAWLLYAAHGLDAPTFTAMIVASCHADPYYTVIAGLSALRGPRMGGATERVLEQLATVPGPESAADWVAQRLASGERIAGFGHGVYHMPDPRVVILRKEAAELARSSGRELQFATARAVENAATRALASRGVHVNINFYGALVFHLLGADAATTPCLVAVGRTAGMVAMIREALETMRLYRPLDHYVGPAERRLAAEPRG